MIEKLPMFGILPLFSGAHVTQRNGRPVEGQRL